MQRLVFKMTVPAELSPSTGEFRQLRPKKLGEEYSLYFGNNTSVCHSLMHCLTLFYKLQRTEHQMVKIKVFWRPFKAFAWDFRAKSAASCPWVESLSSVLHFVLTLAPRVLFDRSLVLALHKKIRSVLQRGVCLLHSVERRMYDLHRF